MTEYSRHDGNSKKQFSLKIPWATWGRGPKEFTLTGTFSGNNLQSGHVYPK